MMKQRFPQKPVELMVVANTIPGERRLTCESRDIECREISEKMFRDVAAEFGYRFASEANAQAVPQTAKSTSRPRDTGNQRADGRNSNWAGQSSGDTQEFLSRCDEEGKAFFTALFEAQKAVPNQTRITWKHESGFSLQFFFHRIGFAPLVWGFPAKTRNGRSIRQRLDFPFDFSLKSGVPQTFINEFGASLSSVVPLSGGGKRPSIPIATLQPDEITRIVDTIFSFVAKAMAK